MFRLAVCVVVFACCLVAAFFFALFTVVSMLKDTIEHVGNCDPQMQFVIIFRCLITICGEVVVGVLASKKLYWSQCPDCREGRVLVRCRHCGGSGTRDGMMFQSECPYCRGCRYKAEICQSCNGDVRLPRWKAPFGVPVSTGSGLAVPILLQFIIVPYALFQDAWAAQSDTVGCADEYAVCPWSCNVLQFSTEEEQYLNCIKTFHCFVFVKYTFCFLPVAFLLLVAVRAKAYPHLRLIGQLLLFLLSLVLVFNICRIIWTFAERCGNAATGAGMVLLFLFLDSMYMLLPCFPGEVSINKKKMRGLSLQNYSDDEDTEASSSESEDSSSACE